ncbi:putative Metallo-dependent phosphatase [Monocercomonoides exilis]|uniref:putative Metallo-dependent phosphatase n=1 Tax=Monocercomonoides exilis TaxID=2049356 RepID=UPI00355A4D33|nr:putative Metallo-dependent phosphatase [Monocercomonoides exilis]|eukprot:MONOS_7881.1-p1 / transcript=MONOS_7881.1 / gene=MONOS_7881 / organism=Monocercomonoides_exilis_PA203 / gene_product=Serine/threonine-protein phosphatase PP2A-2 catalytic subunit / transcript_product=Serine/threonine-protein phosphatase PP2A-2 catalytic subunit / location=Mono_scaffold00281:54922-56459(+) / protein_length=331 / sequence_SO=supercontig / SO=protein_coding / is_pseudo=false
MLTHSLDEALEYVMKVNILNEDKVRAMCEQVKTILLQESNVRIINAPCTIVGDIHGQFLDLLEMFEIAGKCPFTNFLFLGDYVDRGHHCVETITLLFLLKIRYPERITLLRGNHECMSLSSSYGFYTECKQKYGSSTTIWNYFTDAFNFLPLAAIVGGRLFCVHGGLSPDIQTIDQIRILDRFQDIPHEGPMNDLLWSDPDEKIDGFAQSERGAGYLFGKDIVNAFLHRNKMTHIIRAHQLCYEGYNLQFYNTVVTVWSAPDYCYRCKNVGAVLEVDDALSMFFNTFYKSPYSERLSTSVADSIAKEFSFDSDQDDDGKYYHPERMGFST